MGLTSGLRDFRARLIGLDEKLRYVRIQLDKVSLRNLLEELLDTISFEAYQKGLDLALDDRLSQDDYEVVAVLALSLPGIPSRLQLMIN